VHPDRVLDEYAARQYGTFSLDQTRAAGHTPKMVHNRVEKGAWIRLAPSIYALASAPPKWERQMAAALLSRPGSIAGGRSAAYLHGFDGFGPTRPVIILPDDAHARSPLARVIRSKRFDAIGRVRRRGFVVSNEAETIVTLARDLGAEDLEKLVDWVLARKSCSFEEIVHVVEQSDGMPGIRKLRPIVDYRSPDTYQPPVTELERLLYRLLDHPLLPDYTRQMPMRYRRVTATVDAYIPSWTLIVEGDGRRWHNRRADHDRDRRRDNEATAHGYAVLRFTYEMLRDQADECLDTLFRTGAVRVAS
jgi:very-short-patch-repair endonuclease